MAVREWSWRPWHFFHYFLIIPCTTTLFLFSNLCVFPHLKDHGARNILALVGLLIGYRALAYVFLKLRTRKRRWQGRFPLPDIFPIMRPSINIFRRHISPAGRWTHGRTEINSKNFIPYMFLWFLVLVKYFFRHVRLRGIMATEWIILTVHGDLHWATDDCCPTTSRRVRPHKTDLLITMKRSSGDELQLAIGYFSKTWWHVSLL